ncbi:hypothetical protein D3C72_2098140 [compost metagenome]
MVAEQHIFVGRHVVEAIVVLEGRRHATRVQAQHLVGDEQAVETVGDQIDADGGDDDPDRADRFAALQGDDAQGPGACQRKRCPAELFENAVHASSRDMTGAVPCDDVCCRAWSSPVWV